MARQKHDQIVRKFSFFVQTKHTHASFTTMDELCKFPSAAFVVKDDDLGFEDDVLGAFEIELDDAEFIMRPRETIPLTLQLLEADDSGFINDMKAMSRAVCFRRLVLVCNCG
jgi:hypothetical protein